MLTLVIDTATKACSVALYDDHIVVASHYEVIGRGHAERLLPLIAALPARGHSDRIMVDVGPGSFTGIRVGVAAARALGLAWGIPVYGYGCLALVAAMARTQVGASTSVDVVMIGGHGEYFFESFSADGASLAEAVSLTPEQVAAGLTGTTVAGDIDLDIAGVTHLNLLPDASQWHLISGAFLLPPSPIYGRPPDAKPQKVAAT
jgi:tRNA threonylcarbamoyladenosine biosynthesis protein TsaB